MSQASTRQSITGNQLMKLMQQLRRHAGIKIESPQTVIEYNVRDRMAVLGIENMSEYLGLFDDSMNARAEWLALMDLLTVKETRFFRQPAALEGLASYVEELMAGSSAPSELSFWSAGCSTGQELYSMAMVVEQILSQQQPWLEWHGIGTDISFLAVSRAQRGVYPEATVQSIPPHYREQYVSTIENKDCQVSEDIRARTHFFHSNLLHVDGTPFSDFNIIFCQNVLIYFERDKQSWIIDQLAARLRPGGLLVLGAGEDVRWNNSDMQRVSWPGVCAYKKNVGGFS